MQSDQTILASNTHSLISNELLNIFCVESDGGSVQEKIDRVRERFYVARKMYQDVINHPSFSSAFFYRLEDKDNVFSEYEKKFKEALEIFTVQAKSNFRLRMKSQINKFFQEKMREDFNLPDNFFESLSLSLSSRSVAVEEVVDEWGSSIEVLQMLNKISERRFFMVANVGHARNAGIIYSPKDPAHPEHVPVNHNWGVNVAWILAVTSKLATIRILSDFKESNATRRPHVDSNKSSAFALDI